MSATALLKPPALQAVIVGCTLLIFSVDVFMPVGFPLGVLYIIPVYFTTWAPHRAVRLGAPAAASMLIGLAYFIAPQEGLSAYATLNHLLAIVVVWVTAGIAQVHRRLRLQVEAVLASLEERIRARTSELEQSNRQLQELNRLKSAFVSVASHEIRTPVTAIKGYAENLLDEVLGPLTDPQRRYLSRITVNIERLVHIIEELLNLATIEAGQVTLHRQPVGVASLVMDTAETLRPHAQRKGMVIDIAVKPDDLVVSADPEKLRQVLTNLVGNAIKFGVEGGHVAVEAVIRNGALELSVSDDGPGIAAEELPRLFERFYRGRSSLGKEHGAGLGLSIAKTLIELHGGRIRAESTVGVGSRFIIVLPRQ